MSRPFPGGGAATEDDTRTQSYNIIPIHDHLSDHPSLRYPEVRAAIAALQAVGDLRSPPYTRWHSRMDLLDWLGMFFGFQDANVRNQREHLVLLLSNSQMRRPPSNIDVLDSGIVRKLRKKLLHNYTSWCSYLGRSPNVWAENRSVDPRRDLLYISLYLLIWGEAANVRFVPECLCYIFHRLCGELNGILNDYIDPNTGAAVVPVSNGENGFLLKVVTPIYKTIKIEVDSSKNGTAPHAAWRNYDDINEYFWSKRCFELIGWPMDLSRGFFFHGRGVGKTGFVEQRTFWNLFRSFDRLWVMLILFLQAAIIAAWDGHTYPWQGLRRKDEWVKLLSIFITWSGLRLLQAVLNFSTQYSLVSRETPWLIVRMTLKAVAAVAWTAAFAILYGRIWAQRNQDGRWSDAANERVTNCLEAVVVFISPEILAVVLLFIPWARNFIEGSNTRLAYLLTWWFQTQAFVGRGLREGVIDNVKYGLFWVALLFVKFTFSYFLQIKPMVAPTRSVLELDDIEYNWHQFFRNSNRFTLVVIWLPVVLIYMMDISIWYSIFSSAVGVLVGLLAHLGEIRNVHQLRLRFQLFASAMQFNLLPEERLLQNTWSMNLRGRFENFIQRLKLRYGLGTPYRKIESTQVEVTRFSLIWNEVIHAFREEDIISDREMELLVLPSNCWGISVLRWPCFLLCNELQIALSQAKPFVSGDQKLWRRISKHEYRKCAVIEAYDSVKFLLLALVKEHTEEHSIMHSIISSLDDSIRFNKFTEEYKMSVLPKIHSTVVSLVGFLIKPSKDLVKVVNALQTLYNIVTYDFPQRKRNNEELRQIGWAPTTLTADKLLFEDAVELQSAEDVDFSKQARRLHTILSCTDSMNNVPKNLEARRRIAFFSNSVFMTMPRAPPVEKMLPFSVLTPFYSEEVLFSRMQLKDENEDGVSILYYLRMIYADEWENFKERMRGKGMVKEDELWGEKQRLMDLRLWASHRGQTLSRTVRGMMYYYRALKMLAFLDFAPEIDMNERSRELAQIEGSSPRNLRNGLFEGYEHGTAQMKYTYVVACQIYGTQKKNKDPRALEIQYLMKNNEALRVAYVDEIDDVKGKEYYSVLVKYDQQLDEEVEIYRVRLPGPLKLGEGKPENQNHALIFTRGEAVQTIDMNQDNYFEESLKMRNLLEEFHRNHGTRKPTILGVREHIFTGSVSSLAWFMSAQETSFVTLGQRVLANPLKVRMHYGHPDVFDRIWFLSRGGISKASRVINISEDIFAGFNCTLRGGNVTHHEYIQVGKGRDVGLNQISLFEAKVASGNGEQVSSRDVYRLGHNLDFFRMLSFYFTSVGFYFGTMLVVLTVYAFVWGRLYLSLSGIEASVLNSGASDNTALTSVLNQQFIIQLGIFTALPMILENSLEHGTLYSVWEFIKMQLQLASVFYSFSMGTRSHYFGRTILHGGAKYQATGRGFVVEHKSFCENYRLYARSHFVKAIELGLILGIYASYSPAARGTFVYIVLTISSWFLVFSWLMAPFLFNPSGFDWLKTIKDFDNFMDWIWHKGGIFSESKESWETWWNEQWSHLRTTGIWGKLLEIIIDLRFFFFQYGIVYELKIANGSSNIAVYLLSWICIIVALGGFIMISYARDKYSVKEHIYYRTVQTFVIVSVLLVIIILLRFTNFGFTDIFTSLVAFIPTGWGLILISQVIRTFINPKSTVVWNTVVSIGRYYDILFGVIVMVPVALLSWFPGFQSMQTKILFNDAFSRGLEMSRILLGKNATTGKGSGSQNQKESAANLHSKQK